MAELSFEEAFGGKAAATPSTGASPNSGEISLEEAMGQKPAAAQQSQTQAAPAAPPQTPATDRSLEASHGLWGQLFSQPRTQAEYTSMHGRPPTPTSWQDFMDKTGQPIGGALPRYSEEAYRRNSPLAATWPKPPWAVQTAGGVYNAAAGLSDFVTSPRGLAELGATVLQPELGYAFAGAEIGPHLKEQVPLIAKAATGQLPPEQSAEVAGGLGLLLAPGAHGLARRFGPPEFVPAPPSPPGTAYGPLAFEAPPPPMGRPYTERVSPEEAVGPVVEQTGKPLEAKPPIQKEELKAAVTEAETPIDVKTRVKPAIKMTSGRIFSDNNHGLAAHKAESEGYNLDTDVAEVGWLDDTTQPGKFTAGDAYKPSLEAAKESAGNRGLEPPTTPPIVKPSAPIEATKIEPTAPKERKDMTATELSADIARQRADPAAPPVNISDTQMLQRKIEEEAKAPPEAPSETTPLKKLLSPQQLSEYQHLLDRWGELDLEGGQLIEDPKNPRAWQIAAEQGELKKRMYAMLHPLPNGDIYDIVQVGAGAAGLTTGVHGGVENLKTVVLEHSTGKGTASGKTGRYANVQGAESPLGQSGPKRELIGKLQGLRMGTEYKTISEISSAVRDPETKIWTIKTKGLGEGGEGGETLRAKIMTYSTGSRPRGAPFKLLDEKGQAIENTDLGEPGKTIHIDDARGMRREAGAGGDMAAIGAANSSAQGAEIVAAKPNSGVFHLIGRGPDLSSVSDYYLPSLRVLVKRGQVKVHLDSTVDHVEAPSAANGNNYVIVTKETPKERLPPGTPLPGPVKERIPVKAVGSFIGSVPNTQAVPGNFLKYPMKRGDPLSGLIRTTEDLRPIEIGPDGKERPVEGAFIGGSVRAAPGVNRMQTAEGEGSRMVALLLGDLAKMKSPQWRTDLRKIMQSLGDISEEPFAGEVPGALSREHWGEPATPILSGGKVPKAKTPKAPGEKVLPPPPSPPQPILSQNQQQQQEGQGRFFVIPGAMRPPEIEVARQIAEKQHEGQKYGDKPYTAHVQEVVDAVRPELKPAAYLHDVVEDTRISPRRLAEQGVSNRTIDTVNILTRRPGEGYANYIERVSGNADAREIKMADLRANLRTLPEDATLRPRYTKALDRLNAVQTAAADPALIQEEAARRIAANPVYADSLLKDLTSGARGRIDAADEAVLANHRATMQDARDLAGRRVTDTTLPARERANAAATFEDMDARVRETEQVTDEGNIFNNPKVRQMWHQFRVRDYNQPSMEQKLEVAKGGKPVTDAEKADLKRKVDTLATRMGAVEKYKAKIGWRPGMGEKGDIGNLRHKQFKVQEAKDALDNTIFAATLKHKNALNKTLIQARELSALPRALMASTDLSAVRRQGGLFFMGNPVRSIRIMGDMLRAAKSDENYFKLMQDIRERPNAELYISSKLGLTDIKTPQLSKMEEMYLSRWADKIPLLNHSQRAYVYFLNRLRADVFDTMKDNLGRNGNITDRQARELSNFINVWTGRGELPQQFAQSAALLNEFFFAPRYTMSRFQALTLQPLRFAKDPMVRKLIAAEYAKTLAGYAVVYGLVNAAGFKVEHDIRSSDFGKIVIGNTHIDILSGLSQPTVFLARTLPYIASSIPTGQTKTASGKLVRLGGQHQPFSQRNVSNVITDFVRSKLAPLPAAYWNVIKGQRVTGEPTNLTKELLSLITPLSGNDVYSAMKEHGLVKGAALGLLAFFGDSVNTYSPKAAKVRQPKPHRSRSE